MCPVELEMGPKGPVSQKRGGRTGSRLSPKDTLPMGEEEEDLVFLCVSAEMETEPGSRVVCGGSAICLKGIERSCPV